MLMVAVVRDGRIMPELSGWFNPGRRRGLNINALNLQDWTLFINMPANQNSSDFCAAARPILTR
jgi:hypothetical protein